MPDVVSTVFLGKKSFKKGFYAITVFYKKFQEKYVIVVVNRQPLIFLV